MTDDDTHEPARSVGIVVDLTVTVLHPDTSASVTLTATNDPTSEATVGDLLSGYLPSTVAALVDRVAPSVAALADSLLEGS